VEVTVARAGLLVASEDGETPNSQLVGAVHRYVAEFFEREGVAGGLTRRFEETALLALGGGFWHGARR
jgi:hypothetical protein